jgi:hypothetical protein
MVWNMIGILPKVVYNESHSQAWFSHRHKLTFELICLTIVMAESLMKLVLQLWKIKWNNILSRSLSVLKQLRLGLLNVKFQSKCSYFYDTNIGLTL